MPFEDIQTLRCTLQVTTSPGEVTWTGVDGSITIRAHDAGWRGPWVSWTGSSSTCREAVRAVVEAVMDAVDTELVLQVEYTGDESWSPRKLGFERSWSAEEPGVLRFLRSSAFGATEKPLRGLVVSLSGGGIRASAYSLGVFQILEETGLLPLVKCVTSVSGGAMFAGAWTAARARGQAFDVFSERLIDFLAGERRRSPTSSSSPSLIRRYADLLAEHLFGDGTEGPLKLADLPTVPEVVFQATELTRAGSFVFAVGSSVKQGSPNKLALPSNLTGSIRLADAVAASAAYPVGFEPLVFPRDFVLSPEARAEFTACMVRARERGTWPVDARESIPLIDGGVFDNQGLHAAMNAGRRHDEDCELLVIADVAVTEAQRSIWVPGQLESDASVLAGLIAGVVLVLVLGWLLATFVPPWLIVVLVFAAVTVAAFAIPSLVLGRLRTILPPDLSMSGLQSPTGFIHGVGLRAQIASVLLQDVFLERLRSVRYQMLFDRRAALRPAFTRIQDLERIRDAAEGTTLAAFRTRYPLPSGALEHVATACSVPTVLHLDGDLPQRRATLNSLVQAGRITTLAGLLLAIERADQPRSRALRALRDDLATRLSEAG